ncbi:MAG TPA: hypothetical protein VLH79_02810 [Chthonomonadales bacterium]|nr:hypothetical protein [Chthonomonadales bacterium]
MNVANLSPSDRVKVIVLLAAIVVCLVIAGTMVVGAVSGKSPPKTVAKSAETAASATASDAAAATPIGTAPGDFPIASNQTKDLNLATAAGVKLDVRDPFAPEPSLEPGPSMVDHNRPAVRATPSGPSSPSPLPEPVHFGRPSSGLGMPLHPSSGLGGPAGLTAVPVEPVEPEIRLIGIVSGQPSVATLSVAGKTLIARDGDLLAPGYRLLSITPDGVSLRRAGVVQKVRVGTAINSPAGASAERSPP